MTNQTATIPHSSQIGLLFEDTIGDIAPSKFCQEIIDDLSVSQQHIASLSDTISEGIDIKGLFPDKLPKPTELRYSFSILQEWEGYVVSISKDTFTARLVDVTRNCSMEDEEADFPIADLEDNDRTRIHTGAIFRWIIGYHRSAGGTKDRTSRIVLRNLPSWTKAELEKNQRDAAEWASKLNGE